MSAVDDIHEDMYWWQVEQGMILATKLIKAHERVSHDAIHRRWEKHWRTRVTRTLHQLADKLTLPEPIERR